MWEAHLLSIWVKVFGKNQFWKFKKGHVLESRVFMSVGMQMRLNDKFNLLLQVNAHLNISF